MKKLDPFLPQAIIFFVFIPLLFAVGTYFIVQKMPQYFWIPLAFLLVDFVLCFVLFSDFYRYFRHAPIYLSSDGIRVPEGLIRWEDLKITICPFYFRTCYLFAYFARRPLAEAETRQKKQRNFITLSRRNLERILEYYPNRFYFTFSSDPPSYYLAVRRMIHTMDQHNRSVSEKQKKETTP